MNVLILAGLVGFLIGLAFGVWCSYDFAGFEMRDKLRKAQIGWNACAQRSVDWHRELVNTRTSLGAKNFRLRATITHLRQKIRKLEMANEVVQSRSPAPVGPARAEAVQAGAGGVEQGARQPALGSEPPGAVPDQYSPASAEAMMRLWRESGTGIGVYVRLPNGNEPVYMGGMHDKIASSDTIEIAIGWLTQLKYEALLQEKGVHYGG